MTPKDWDLHHKYDGKAWRKNTKVVMAEGPPIKFSEYLGIIESQALSRPSKIAKTDAQRSATQPAKSMFVNVTNHDDDDDDATDDRTDDE